MLWKKKKKENGATEDMFWLVLKLATFLISGFDFKLSFSFALHKTPSYLSEFIHLPHITSHLIIGSKDLPNFPAHSPVLISSFPVHSHQGTLCKGCCHNNVQLAIVDQNLKWNGAMDQYRIPQGKQTSRSKCKERKGWGSHWRFPPVVLNIPRLKYTPNWSQQLYSSHGHDPCLKGIFGRACSGKDSRKPFFLPGGSNPDMAHGMRGLMEDPLSWQRLWQPNYF